MGTQLVRAFASGAAGVFIAEVAQPYIEKVIKPDTAFAAKAIKAGAAGVGTATAWYVLGALGMKAG